VPSSTLVQIPGRGALREIMPRVIFNQCTAMFLFKAFVLAILTPLAFAEIVVNQVERMAIATKKFELLPFFDVMFGQHFPLGVA
jgi:hypothetical protein